MSKKFLATIIKHLPKRYPRRDYTKPRFDMDAAAVFKLNKRLVVARNQGEVDALIAQGSEYLGTGRELVERLSILFEEVEQVDEDLV